MERQAGNTDKQGGNILVQTTYGNQEAMEKKEDIQAVLAKGSHSPVADGMADGIMLENLAEMRDMDIREANRETLADILEIKVDEDLSDTDKRKEFIRQIKNPYLYRQGEYIVKLSFADTDATLTDRLKEYIEHVAAAGLWE